MERELSTPVENLTSDGGSHNRININTPLNELLIDLSVKLGLLDSSHSDLCLDFDHQFIPCEKDDASYNYKKKKGISQVLPASTTYQCMLRIVMGTAM